MIQSAKQANKVFVLLLAIGLGLAGLDQLGLIQAQTATVTSTRSILIVDTVADLANLTPIDGTIVQTRGYNSAGDGGGNSYRYSKVASVTVDGGFYINGPNSIGRYVAENKDSGIINAKQFGAVGSGDDGPEVLAALNAAISSDAVLYFPDGTYTLTTWSEKSTTGKVVMRGSDVTISKTSGSFLLLNTGADVDIEGITFSGWTEVFTTDNDPDSLRLHNVTFSSVGVPITENALGETDSIDRFEITNCTLSGCGQGLNLRADSIGSAIVHENEVLNCTSSLYSIGGIWVSNTAWTDSGLISIKGNRVDIVTTSAVSQPAYGIIAFGQNVVIDGNSVTGVSCATQKESYGIYTKAQSGVISNNTLIDAAEDCYISVKDLDTDPASMSVSGNSLVMETVVDNTWGIEYSRGDIAVTENTIRGAFVCGIQGRQSLATISNNIIDVAGITADASITDGRMAGILLIDCGDTDISHNVISFDAQLSNTGAYAIGLVAASGTVSRVSVSENIIKQVLHINAIRFGVFLDNVSGTVDSIKIQDNKINECNTGIRIDTGCTNVEVLDNDMSNINTNEISASSDPFVRHRRTGTPESVIPATAGSVVYRKDGGTSTSLYVKESSSGNTGWVAK